MTLGPTQNYEGHGLVGWKPRPVLAWTIRLAVGALPVVLALGWGLVAMRWFPPERLGVGTVVWVVGLVGVSGLLVAAGTRVSRHLLPLSTMLRLTLYFPDHAPSRLAVAMRHYSPQPLVGRLDGVARRRGGRPGELHAELLLGLVAAIDRHDPVTRGHSERVQAYAALIGEELGLGAEDAAKLSWAALLHDVGKTRVPAKVVAKPGRPTAEEWRLLQSHPHEGTKIAAPLAAWLGPWFDTIGQHHERWDGTGYPSSLAGTSISIGARIVAVADAFDAITSARTYKQPLPAAMARAELARCAGQQFDPVVVRAFLAVGLGRVRRVAGPVSLLAALPGLRSLDVSVPAWLPGSGALATGATAGLVTLGVSVVALIGAEVHVAAPVAVVTAEVEAVEEDDGVGVEGSGPALPTPPSASGVPGGPGEDAGDVGGPVVVPILLPAPSDADGGADADGVAPSGEAPPMPPPAQPSEGSAAAPATTTATLPPTGPVGEPAVPAGSPETSTTPPPEPAAPSTIHRPSTPAASVARDDGDDGDDGDDDDGDDDDGDDG